MIVPMQHITLLCVASESERTLEKLHTLGCVHLQLSQGATPAVLQAKDRLDQAEKAIRLVTKASEGLSSEAAQVHAPSVRGESLVETILKLDEVRQTAQDDVQRLASLVRTYRPFGDFDLASLTALESAHLVVQLARTRMGETIQVSPGLVKELAHDDTSKYLALIYPQGAEIKGAFEKVPLPPMRLVELEKQLREAHEKEKQNRLALASLKARLSTIQNQFPKWQDQLAFEEARAQLEAQGVVSWIQGWVPVDCVPRVRGHALQNAWGLVLRAPAPGETPPTLIRPPKLFRPVAALFQGLGIAPAYEESDVSVPFMCYFALFFAMLVGDGGYGALIFVLTLMGWWKTKPHEGATHRPRLVRSWLTLLTVFSLATIVWGLLSNTWFGAAIPACASWPTVVWLADQTYQNMMLLCFTIGVSHLMIARIWSGLCLLNDRTCLAQFGWAGIILFMYLVANSIVGIFSGIPTWGYCVFGLSLVGVFGFTLKGSELKTRGVELGMLPLNIMSALGDVISYVRLFAVGLASVKVAQNFNEMALSLDLPLWIKWFPLVLILLVGHGLNFAMAGLSILVHAVRLNTLEFSNHKGVSWAGYAFHPFKHQASRA